MSHVWGKKTCPLYTTRSTTVWREGKMDINKTKLKVPMSGWIFLCFLLMLNEIKRRKAHSTMLTTYSWRWSHDWLLFLVFLSFAHCIKSLLYFICQYECICFYEIQKQWLTAWELMVAALRDLTCLFVHAGCCRKKWTFVGTSVPNRQRASLMEPFQRASWTYHSQ